MPEAKQEVLLERMVHDEATVETPTVIPFEDGETFAVDGTELEVVHTPGHAAGLSMFEAEIDGQRVVFSGDTLLPVYTPNVGGADVRVDRPLEKYLRALRGMVDADYDRAWPGHRDPIADPTGRAQYIIDHHEERSWRVLDALDRTGPCDTWTVSAELFGELDSIHILHGPGESYAHLEHLEREGNRRPRGARVPARRRRFRRARGTRGGALAPRVLSRRRFRSILFAYELARCVNGTVGADGNAVEEVSCYRGNRESPRPPQPISVHGAQRPSAHGGSAAVRMVCETGGLALFAWFAGPLVPR